MIIRMEAALLLTILLIKLLYIIWKKKQILRLLRAIGVYSIEDQEEFLLVNHNLKILMKFVTVFLSLTYFASFRCLLILPFLASEKRLFPNIGFPLNWENNEVSYWVAFTFVFTEGTLSSLTILFSIIMWYLMFNCALKYEILGYQIKKMGVRRVEGTAS